MLSLQFLIAILMFVKLGECQYWKCFCSTGNGIDILQSEQVCNNKIQTLNKNRSTQIYFNQTDYNCYYLQTYDGYIDSCNNQNDSSCNELQVSLMPNCNVGYGNTGC